ncbi:Receptor-type tyrosine-protein kinase FLT3 [Stylophora pistillata]|uniref:Receptor-type tyrosine-protein kinase FLT3 n=1 Tax=Stylophora pistillata TaxID=50429 RepID=A0A2B4SNF0_STYPI|nr:Receptor-type tyrosine-protein kinase FLT3 [Stylophora pistillata]
MKAIGTHPNVVRMLGCWVHSDPVFLLLEYVPYGDLLHWLRSKRILKSYQKHYDKFNKPLQLDINVVQISGKDGSRALLLKNEEGSDEDLNTKGIPKAVSTSVSLGALSVESASKEKKHVIDEAQTEVRDRVENQYEKGPMQASQDCQNNMEPVEDFDINTISSEQRMRI